MTRVLVADDSETILLLLRTRLEMEGYEVSTATDGQEVVEALAAMEPGQEPHLILLDAMMPGLSGFEVLRRLKSDPTLRAVPVIMVTAKGHERDVLSGLRGGAVDYVVKPFSLKELAARVDLALRKEPPATAS